MKTERFYDYFYGTMCLITGIFLMFNRWPGKFTLIVAGLLFIFIGKRGLHRELKNYRRKKKNVK